MENVVIFANCQSGAIKKTLEESAQFNQRFKILEIPFVQNIRTEQQKADVVEKVLSCDVFIYQNVKDLGWGASFNSDSLLALLGEHDRSISIPSMYFDGYFPQLATMSGLKGPLNLVHDYFIASAYLLGLTQQQTVSMLLCEDLYSSDLAKHLANTSLKNLSLRESKQQIDIRISDYVSANFRKRKLFNQFNHPRRELTNYVSLKIMDMLGLKESELVASGKGYLDALEVPIYPSSHHALGLDFEDTMQFTSGLKTLELTEVVAEFWNLYSTIEKIELHHNIKIKKPFVLELVSKYKRKNNL